MFEIQDLMTFLEEAYDEYAEHLVDHDKENEFIVVDDHDNHDPVATFANFCRNYLSNVNQPTNITYLTRGIGVRLQHGQTVAFIEQHEDSGMRDEGIHITKPITNPGQGLLPTYTVPVTGR